MMISKEERVGGCSTQDNSSNGGDHRRNSYGGEDSSKPGLGGSLSGSPKPQKLRTGSGVVNSRVEIMEVLSQLEDRDVLQVIAAVSHKSGEKNLGNLLYSFAGKRGRESVLLETILRLEVEVTQKAELLFREESLCTQIVNAALSPYSVPYFQTFIQPILTQAKEQGLNAEVDPAKMTKTPSEKELKQQREKLENFTENILRSVYNSVFSPEMSHIFNLISKVVSEKFKDSGRLGVSSFLFLRLICVTILNSSSPATARTFLLAAKIIQNLANEVKFQKELYMLDFNNFLEKHKQPLEDFYARLLTNEKTYLLSSMVLDKYVLLKDFLPLSDFIQQYFFPMRRECRGSPNGKRTMEIMNNLSALGKLARGFNDIARSAPAATAALPPQVDGLRHSNSEPICQTNQINLSPLLRAHTIAAVPSPTNSTYSSTSSEDDTGSDCSTSSTSSSSSSEANITQVEGRNLKRMSAENLGALFQKPIENEKRLSSDAIQNVLKRKISGKELLECKSHQDLASLGFTFKDRQLLLRFISDTN